MNKDEIMAILKENGFIESSRKNNLYFKEMDNMIVYADLRSGKLRWYAYEDGKSVLPGILDGRIKRLKHAIDARAKGQQRLMI